MPRGPRPWPNEVKWARDDAIMELMIAKKELRSVIKADGDMNDRQQLQGLAEVQHHLFEALRFLQATLAYDATRKAEETT